MRQKVRNILVLLFALPFLNGFMPDRAGDVSPDDRPAAYRPLTGKETIRWMTLAQAEAKQQQARKPILIDLYTDWCGWCKVMDKKTYAREEVARYINEHFYAVKLDAEGRETLSWQGKPYTYNANARIHNLAIYLTNGQLSFPHTIFMMPGDPRPQAIPGYLEIKDMELLLKFFGEGHYGKTDFPDYQKKFSPSWK